MRSTLRPSRTGSRTRRRRPRPSRKIGDWLLGGLLGEGSLARVFAARPLGAREDSYALKLLRRRWEADPRALECLCREALVSREASHPRLISILAAEVAEPPYYLVAPRLHGQTLGQLASRGSPCLSALLGLARQAAEGLAALWRAGWTHGDIKPDNLFVSNSGALTLLDLGFARRRDDDADGDLTLAGAPWYLAPERLREGPPDIRGDVYSLGAVLYESLAGRPPFPARSLEELACLQRSAAPPPLAELCPRIPADAARLVHRLLDPDVDRRPTPDELVELLLQQELATFHDRRAVARVWDPESRAPR